MGIKSKKNLTDQEIMSLLKEHSDILKKYKVKRIGLFGSYIKGKQKRQSDIDLLVEFEDTAFSADSNFNGYFDTYMELLSTLEEICGRKVDLLTIEMISPYIQPYILKDIEYVKAS